MLLCIQSIVAKYKEIHSVHTQILKSYNSTKAYIDKVRENADLNKESFGFLPFSAYEEFALTGRLWILISSKTEELWGYLIFSENYPVLRIQQLFVDNKHRKKGVAKQLVDELIKYGEDNYFSTIRAKVATELAANQFWEKINF